MMNNINFKIGNSVIVKPDVQDPDLGIDITGWQGRVSEIDTEENIVCIEWDSITLKNIPRSMIDKCEEEGFEWWSPVWLDPTEIEIATPRDSEEDVAEIINQLQAKDVENSLAEESVLNQNEDQKETRSRGWGLSLLLILMLCGQLWFAYLLFTSLLEVPYHPLVPDEPPVPLEAYFGPSFPIWLPIITVTLSILTIIFLLSIWRWKKWGVYGLMATWVIGVVVNISVWGITYVPCFLPTLVFLAILGFLMKRKWQLFK